MKRNKVALALAVLSLAALACAGLSLPSAGDLVGTALATTGLDDLVQMSTMMANGTAVPLETLMTQFGEQASGAVIYQDDFSDTATGWPIDSFAEGSTGYHQGQYRITVDETDYAIWAVSGGGPYMDISVEVDAVKFGGTDENEFGLICRLVDNGNFYAATIASDGYYFIWRRINYGEWELVGMDEGEVSQAIFTGSQSNRIRLDCVGSSIALYANGTLLREVYDSSLTSGDVGVYAGAFSVAGVDVVFDNFKVSQP